MTATVCSPTCVYASADIVQRSGTSRVEGRGSLESVWLIGKFSGEGHQPSPTHANGVALLARVGVGNATRRVTEPDPMKCLVFGFAGLVAPGEFQFNIVVPSSAPDGDLGISASYNGAFTPNSATLAVQH